MRHERLHDGNPWTVTYSGRKFHFFGGDQDEIDINDIAHSLSLNCRFNGHVKHFYSVAQHSLIIGKQILKETGKPSWAMAGLLHDASEAYLPDMPRPIKGYLSEFLDLEDAVLGRIFRRFDLPDLTMPTQEHLPLAELIKLHDNRAVVTEKRDILTEDSRLVPWAIQDKYEPYEDRIIPETPKNIWRQFLQFFREMGEAREYEV